MDSGFCVGNWQVEPDLNRLTRAGKTVQIEPKVMDVLVFLASHPCEVCPKDMIIKAIWPDTFVSDDVLSYGISELRKAFGDNARYPSVIATIPKRGYRLIAPVSRPGDMFRDEVSAHPESRAMDNIHSAQDPEPQQEPTLKLAQEGAEQDATLPTRPAASEPSKLQRLGGEPAAWSISGVWRAKPSRKAIIALLLFSLVLIPLAWHLSRKQRSGLSMTGFVPPLTAATRSIAVIPFENLSPDPQNAFFAAGFSEDLINQLSKIWRFRVISRAAVSRYQDTPDLSEMGADLGAEVILRGSVRREGNQVRIAAQLIEAKTGRHLWGETYDRKLTGIFGIQGDVARSIAAALEVQLSASELGQIQKQPTANLSAYDYYLKGREYYRRYRSRDNEKAAALFEKALELDPEFALAYAGLADAFAQKVYQFGFPDEWTGKATEAGRKALSIDKDLAEAHKAFGFALGIRGRYREALEAYYRAVELNPNFSAPVNNIGVILEEQGKFCEALQWTQRALSLNPTESISYFNVGDIYRDLHDLDRAEEWYKKALSLDPDYEPALVAMSRLLIVRERYAEALEQSRKIIALDSDSVRGLNAAGDAHQASGNLRKAEECYRRVLALKSNQNAALRLSLILWKRGSTDEAGKLFDSLVRLSRLHIDAGSESWRASWVMAVVHAAQDETDAALSWLDEAAAAGWRPRPGAWRDLEYQNLVGNERFRKLMARLEDDIDQQRRRALLLASPAE